MYLQINYELEVAAAKCTVLLHSHVDGLDTTDGSRQ